MGESFIPFCSISWYHSLIKEVAPMKEFYSQRPYLENEFEQAVWIPDSGLDAQLLSQGFDTWLVEHETLPPPLLRAGALAWLLDNCQISINPHSIFCHKLNLGVTYNSKDADSDFLKKQLHEAGPDIMENQLFYPRNRRLQERLAPNEAHCNRTAIEIGAGRACADFRHASPDWKEVFRLGFSGLRQRAVDCKARKEALTEEQAVFYDGVIVSYDAMIRCLNRIYDASLAFDVPEYSQALLHLIHHPPETTYQAMLLTILFTNFAEIGYEKVRTLGLLDLMYDPYYQADLAAGRCTEEQMTDMIRYFFLHWNAARRGAQQPFGLGGANPVTYMMLSVYEELNIINPKLHLRCAADVPDALLRRVAELIRKGSSSIVLMNDEAVYDGYALLNIPREDAVDYLPMGCYEPYIMGKEEAFICASWTNIAKQVELTITGGRDLLTGISFGSETPTEFASYEDFLNTFYFRLHEMVEMTVGMIEAFSSFATQVNPSPVLSATMASCMEKATDIYGGGMKYNNSTIKCFGIATAVDAILAVKKLVFEEKSLTMASLRAALEHNWDGYELHRQRILHDKNKYGNHLPEPDDLARDIYDHLAHWIIGRPTCRGGVYRLGADSVDFALTEGKKMGATPDGRLAREPISKNLTAVSGMQYSGATALMHSTLALGLDRLLGSAPLDFIVHPSAVQGEAGLNAMVAAFKAYFRAGGMAIHGNVIPFETLLAAQKEPDKYADLQIRVCGWNDYFVNLSKPQQEEFLRQTRVM